MPFKDLKEKFGSHARAIRENKYQLEANRDPKDPSPAWWCQHPDLPNEKEGDFGLMMISNKIWLFLPLKYMDIHVNTVCRIGSSSECGTVLKWSTWRRKRMNITSNIMQM